MDNSQTLCQLLLRGPLSARQLAEKSGFSRATVSRVLTRLGDQVIRFGPYLSVQYALRRNTFTLPSLPVYRITPVGQVQGIGELIPVHPAGFVTLKPTGEAHHTDGLPWWLYDMRPQGFLGRAYVSRYASLLGLPANLKDWQDDHALRALLVHGHDAIGNLVLGDRCREHFLTSAAPVAITEACKAEDYARLSLLAAQGDEPGSSAGGEQPKFAAYVQTPAGDRHVIVKFSLPSLPGHSNSIAQRWQDLLLAEHLALTVLHRHGIHAASTCVIDHQGQRFLEVQRFDRQGASGRHGLISLAAMDAEFVGQGNGHWPALTKPLAQAGHITPQAFETACLLYAYGVLIGNVDMHAGNLSFITDNGRPYDLAPAYDMLPMAFAPRTSGDLPQSLSPARLDAAISPDQWRRALTLADNFVHALRQSKSFSSDFAPCITALDQHLAAAREQVGRMV
jgi:hypothetical protein